MFILFGGILLYLAPLIWEQSINFAKEIPSLYFDFKVWVIAFASDYVGVESKELIISFFGHFSDGIAKAMNLLANNTFGSIVNMGVISLYVVLVPILVFFFIVDKTVILSFFSRFFPEDDKKSTFRYYWSAIDEQLGKYIQGKMLEMLIIGGVTFILFASLGLKYSLLLATAVGLSVLIPFVGAIVVTIPVLAVGFSQWGFGNDFIILAVGYLILQLLDGNLLVPVIFSEKMNIHPVAILMAVLLFGAIGGVAGVFFAIPLIAIAKIYIDRNYPVHDSVIL